MVRWNALSALAASLVLASSVTACSAPADGGAADETGTAVGATGTLVVNEYAIVTGTGGGLNLRSGPSQGSAIHLVMPEGSRVLVTGEVDNGYAPVKYGEQDGWAWGGYLEHVAPPAPPGSLAEAMQTLGTEVATRSPGTDLAITVHDLTSGETASFHGDVLHVSASSAKAIWVAAALDGVGVGPVEPHADAIFRSSDNAASGAVIDLVGTNAVNDFYAKAGMGSSALTQWSYGGRRVATNSPRAMGNDNYFTSDDVVRFLGGIGSDTLLDDGSRAALTGWMQLSPRTGYGGWLGTMLPADARASMMHKAGWLPPGCCSDDSVYNTLNDIGLISTPNGHRYAIAILARRGQDYWGRQVRFVEHASCVVYKSVAKDENIDCQ